METLVGHARVLALLVACLALGVAAGARAQTTGPADATRRVSGRVVRPGASGMLPVASAWVTLHRVGRDSAGPLDSARTTAAGAYGFTYRPWGSDQAVYFVSVSYGGIAYFGEPLRGDAVSGPAAEIAVFDTTTAPLPIAVRGRHLIVSTPAPSGARTVTEVYELSNDSSLTAVAPPNGATFTAVLPEAAIEPRVAGGDIAEDAVSFARGRVTVAAPFAPGIKQLAVAYTLGPREFPLRMPLLRAADVLEVLVEDPAATVSGAGLTAVGPASVSGRTFKRFLAQEVPASAVVQVALPDPPALSRSRFFALVGAVIGAVMLGTLLLALRFRRPAAAPAPAPVPAGTTPAERIAREIAALDAAFEREPAPDAHAREHYAQRRAALKAQLTAALAEQKAS